MSEADERFLVLLAEIEPTKAKMMEVMRQFSRVRGMDGVVDMLSLTLSASKTGKSPDETTCLLAAIKLSEMIRDLRAEGSLAFDEPPRPRSVKRSRYDRN